MTLLFLLLLFLTSLLATPAKAFVLPLYHEAPFHRLTAKAKSAHHNDWSLDEDWALIDGVKTFTIRTSTNQNYTFWGRIVSSDPLLHKRRSASEAEQHHLSLMLQENTTTRLAAGPPPLLLQDWWIRVENSNNYVIGMGGRLDDDRSVWFPVASLGRFDGHVLDNYEAPTCLSAQAIPGGYCEALGGTIYELGRPRASGAIDSVDSTTRQHLETSQSGVPTTTLLAVAFLLALGYLSGMIQGLSIAAPAQSYSRYEHGPAGSIAVVRFPEEIKARDRLRAMENEWLQERFGINDDQYERQVMDLQHLQRNQRLQQQSQVGWGLW